MSLNINQIKYFITLVKCLNFNKAADQLYITQPALSRQISAMELELNMQLFMRTNKKVVPTPAAMALADSLEYIYNEYNTAVAKAKNIDMGLTGYLNIGILDGMRPPNSLIKTINQLNYSHGNLQINIMSYSFNGLTEMLYDGRLDFALTLYFDIEKRTNLMYHVVEKSFDHIVVPTDHRLATLKKVCLLDLKDETFIIPSAEDSHLTNTLIIDACKKEGFIPKFRFAPTVQTVMILVESGIGITVLDSTNVLTESSLVKFLNIDGPPISDPSCCLVWRQDNSNPNLQTFNNIFMSHKN